MTRAHMVPYGTWSRVPCCWKERSFYVLTGMSFHYSFINPTKENFFSKIFLKNSRDVTLSIKLDLLGNKKMVTMGIFVHKHCTKYRLCPFETTVKVRAKCINRGQSLFAFVLFIFCKNYFCSFKVNTTRAGNIFI